MVPRRRLDGCVGWTQAVCKKIAGWAEEEVRIGTRGVYDPSYRVGARDAKGARWMMSWGWFCWLLVRLVGVDGVDGIDRFRWEGRRAGCIDGYGSAREWVVVGWTLDGMLHSSRPVLFIRLFLRSVHLFSSGSRPSYFSFHAPGSAPIAGPPNKRRPAFQNGQNLRSQTQRKVFIFFFFES